jgi:hypothetical protein
MKRYLVFNFFNKISLKIITFLFNKKIEKKIFISIFYYFPIYFLKFLISKIIRLKYIKIKKYKNI